VQGNCLDIKSTVEYNSFFLAREENEIWGKYLNFWVGINNVMTIRIRKISVFCSIKNTENTESCTYSAFEFRQRLSGSPLEEKVINAKAKC